MSKGRPKAFNTKTHTMQPNCPKATIFEKNLEKKSRTSTGNEPQGSINPGEYRQASGSTQIM
jgi:hypothetical protein